MWFWKRKTDPAKAIRDETTADRESGIPCDPAPSLKQAMHTAKLRPEDIQLTISTPSAGNATRPPRTEISITSGTHQAIWQVESLPALFRGNRLPPAEDTMAEYPAAYVPFFYRIEFNVYRSFASANIRPTDAEFQEIYAQLRRRPDGKSLSPLHDTIWQSTALVLGLRPWSEKEYLAVFSQLTRSARHFKMGASSRNYCEYIEHAMNPGGRTQDPFDNA